MIATLIASILTCTPAAYVNDLGDVAELRVDGCNRPVASVELEASEARLVAAALMSAAHGDGESWLRVNGADRVEVTAKFGVVVLSLTDAWGEFGTARMSFVRAEEVAEELLGAVE